MYLWCKLCEHVYTLDQWTRNGKFKNGVCPRPLCGAWQYRFAVPWERIAATEGYDAEPIPGEYYPLHRLDFEA